MTDRLLTVAEVAQQVRTDRATVRRWLRQGKLKATVPDQSRQGYRILESDLGRFIHERSVQAARKLARLTDAEVVEFEERGNEDHSVTG